MFSLLWYNFPRLKTYWRGSIVRPNARAWSACVPRGTVGSNPTLSAPKNRSVI